MYRMSDSMYKHLLFTRISQILDFASTWFVAYEFEFRGFTMIGTLLLVQYFIRLSVSSSFSLVLSFIILKSVYTSWWIDACIWHSCIFDETINEDVLWSRPNMMILSIQNTTTYDMCRVFMMPKKWERALQPQKDRNAYNMTNKCPISGKLKKREIEIVKRNGDFGASTQ